MCFLLPLGQSDRNTCKLSVTNFVFNFICKNKVVTDCNGFLGNLPVFDHFDDKFGGEDKTIESQSSGGPSKDMKNM
jgi:hypothetical protein